MDFFERLFGVSPDGGNGLLELAYLVCMTLVGAMAVYFLFRWRAIKKPSLHN